MFYVSLSWLNHFFYFFWVIQLQEIEIIINASIMHAHRCTHDSSALYSRRPRQKKKQIIWIMFVTCSRIKHLSAICHIYVRLYYYYLFFSLVNVLFRFRIEFRTNVVNVQQQQQHTKTALPQTLQPWWIVFESSQPVASATTQTENAAKLFTFAATSTSQSLLLSTLSLSFSKYLRLF